LLVAPGYEAEVFDYLRAQPTTNRDHYLLTVNTTSGTTVTFLFTVKTAPKEELFLLSNEPAFESSGEEAGVKFKVYKNAECPNRENQNKETGKWVNLPQIDPVTEAASYRSAVTEKHTKCIYNRNENNKYTEFLKKVGTTTYNDKFDGEGKDLPNPVVYMRYRCD